MLSTGLELMAMSGHIEPSTKQKVCGGFVAQAWRLDEG